MINNKTKQRVVATVGKIEIVRINGIKKRGGELFVKIFSQRLAKNEVLSTITERAIREAKQSKQLKLFAEKQSVEIRFNRLFIAAETKTTSNSL